MSEASPSGTPSGGSKDRHEPRGRKPNDHLPPSRAREVQRAFRLRRAEHLASLEERISSLESENNQLRALLNIPDADRSRIGSGPTGRGKTLKDGGVPMSERVRARKEARERERRAKGLAEPDTSEQSDHQKNRDSETLSPDGRHAGSGPASLPLFNSSDSSSFNYNMPMPFSLNPVSADNSFGDFPSGSMESSIFKPSPSNFSGLFNMFEGNHDNRHGHGHSGHRSPLSPPMSNPASATPQPDLLTRLKACCHLSDSHVVNDPGLLIFATRLCQSFPCTFSGVHPDPVLSSDPEHLLLEDSWKALKMQLDPGGDADGENRINTGRMAAELVCRAAASRGGQGNWIVCRYREGMSIKRNMIAQLIVGLGGKPEM